MNIALLLSGGVGSRLQSDIPKQYLRVRDKMLITYSLETLVYSTVIDVILIVAEHDWREFIITDAHKHGISTDKIMDFAAPGYNRQASILNGLQNILQQKTGIVDIESAEDEDNVLIHDAARPMLTGNQIRSCFSMLHNHDGVMPVLPMKDTVYFSEDGNGVSELLDREKIFAGQAPEVFNLKKYYQANMALMPDRIAYINGSTEPAVMAGMDIVMMPGDENNFKITTQADLDRFCRIVEENNGILEIKRNNFYCTQ